MPVHKSSKKCTAFIVPDGHFEFLKVSFGLCNSPAGFNKFVKSAFEDSIRDGFVLMYMGDIIIPANDCERKTQTRFSLYPTKG